MCRCSQPRQQRSDRTTTSETTSKCAPGLHLAGQAEVDVLHVGGRFGPDLPGPFGGVGAADAQVTVSRHTDIEDSQDIPEHRRTFRLRARSWFPRADTAPRAHRAGWQRHRSGSGCQRDDPTLLVQGGAGVVAGEPAVGGEHQRARPGRRLPLEDLDHVPQRVVIGAVKQQRGEPANRVQLVSGQHVCHHFQPVRWKGGPRRTRSCSGPS